MPSTIQPLPRGQQLMLQYLMANHVMSDDEANETFQKLLEQQQQGDEQVMGNAENLEEAFVSINRQLKPGFGLEIVTVVDTDPDTGDKAKYHAVVNTKADEVAKKHAFETAFTVHERAFVRLLLKRLVEEEHFSLKRMDCINLRSDLEGGFKLQLNQAERLIQMLLDEKWLRVSTRGDDDDEEDENDDALSSSQKSRKTSKSTKRRRRESVHNKLELAPRSYLELSHYLTQLGLEAEDMPQFLFHVS
jgi:hypothetical protein